MGSSCSWQLNMLGDEQAVAPSKGSHGQVVEALRAFSLKKPSMEPTSAMVHTGIAEPCIPTAADTVTSLRRLCPSG